MTNILAFETSCDDTAAAIVNNSGEIISEAIFSQIKEHQPFLGVVPEIGSRAHIEQINHIAKQAIDNSGIKLDQIDAIAATFAPGLVGPLLVGAQFAKGIALALNKPLIPVHHIEGHILAGWKDDGFFEPPFISLIASGGHTAIYLCDKNYNMKTLGETLDDAAGEAFDKIGRALGLGYPAGKAIDERGRKGDKKAFTLPIAFKNEDILNFSFSGLKTSALLTIKKHAPFDSNELNDFCASLEEAITTPLCQKTINAAKKYNISQIAIGGGVAANTCLREKISTMGQENGIKVYLPPKKHCVDNAVMIAKAAHVRFAQGKRSQLSADVSPTMPVEESFELYCQP